MKRVVLKILRQEPTSQVEWQNLFTYESSNELKNFTNVRYFFFFNQ